MVTTKGAGLNPNAKVWQEVPAHQDVVPEGTEDSPWLQTYPLPEMTNGFADIPSVGGKGHDTEYADGTADHAPVPAEGMGSSVGALDVGYLAFGAQSEPAVEGDVSQEQPMSEEILRESLKKQLEFCFSRENLSKDLYLISQMDSDQFVPIWTIACMEDIKALTTDLELIVDVLRASPMVQVDESGEKVRPNHSRCIIILREVPETTPVEEVEALFKSENCPKLLCAEFAHNSSWYITFQSDMDALQAYRFLREEVKTFQGKPIMARIKAINTFFGKNGFRSVDYSQHAQPQAQYTSPVYMPQMYSPQQQQYPVYPVVSPSWNPSVMPYFETPLAPFPNGGFMNGYANPGNYKANTTPGHRPMNRNRNYVKGHHMPADLPPSSPSSLTDGLPDPVNPQPMHTSGTHSGTAFVPALMHSFGHKDASLQSIISSGDLNGGGRGRRGSYRGMRRKREDEYNARPVPLMEAKLPPPPNFDLEASNFPPLPGSVVNTRGETAPEVRLSDVVRGLKVTHKSVSQEATEAPSQKVSEDPVLVSGTVDQADSPALVTVQTVAPPIPCVPAKEEDETDHGIPEEPISPSSEAVSPSTSEPVPPTCSETAPTDAPSPSPSTPTSELGLKKLSYAEVCQKMAKDKPPAQMPSPSPPAASTTGQPLQELKVNRGEEPCPAQRGATDKPEKSGDGRPPRQPLRSFRGGNGQARFGSAALKVRENQRGQTAAKPFPPQRGARRTGKEQNIPPCSQK